MVLLAVAALFLWSLFRDKTDDRKAALARACLLLRAPIDMERTTAAKQAFRQALGGAFGEEFVSFGIRVTSHVEAILRGGTAHDPAIGALARGDLRGAERRFGQRGGVEARYGRRLVRCILTQGGEER